MPFYPDVSKEITFFVSFYCLLTAVLYLTIDNKQNCDNFLEKNISFRSTNVSICFQANGLSENEPCGTWSDGKEVVMKMRVKKGKNKILLLNLDAHPYLGKSLKEQIVAVFTNNRQIAVWHLTKKDVYQAEIPAEAMQTEDLKLVFKISNPMSPKSEGLSGDDRNPSIGFNKRVIRTKKEKSRRLVLAKAVGVF